ncbi:MAG: uncharacterized protein QG670_1240 [Thermoproteota archaeon]|nr:uncharacterized protein [Thermoproteota archaeon]
MAEKVKFHTIKTEIRLLGLDGCSSASSRVESTILIGIVFRGGFWLDGAMKTEIKGNGLDVTEKIVNMVKTSPHFDQLRVIMLNRIVFSNFNFVDVRKLFTITRLPVIVMIKRKNMADVKNALRKLPNFEEQWRIIQNSGETVAMKLNGKNTYFLISGIGKGDAEKIVKMSCTRLSIPEPIRVAHVIALGVNKLRNA